MDIKEWAKKEIELACKREKSNSPSYLFDYGCGCYESALKAFNSLLEDGHSGMSISFTKNILNRLIEGKCLTPIEDTDDIWRYSYTKSSGAEVYQCNRMTSLFKEVYSDGTVKYRDINRAVNVNISSNTRWYSGIADKIVDELYPINMPYIPVNNPFEVYCEDFLTNSKNGDYDTVCVLYGIDPNGNKFEINRYFKDGEQGLVEIGRDEYETRKLMDKERRN